MLRPRACEGITSAPHIGRPMQNKRIYIWRSTPAPRADRVTAEIYIGGAGVARGLPDSPELSASAFCPIHFTQEPRPRMYKRSGDLGRWRPDGTMNARPQTISR